MENRSINQRDVTIDIIKGIGIICMVAGHCGSPMTRFIYLFHMAVFFMASGYCYKEKNSTNGKQVIQFIKRKFATLWFPYVLWTAVYSILHNFFIHINVYTDNPLLLTYVSGKEISLTEYWSMADVVKNILKSLVLHGGTELGSAFWFLATLMEISIAYCIIDFILFRFTKSDNAHDIAQLTISVVFLLIGFACFKMNHSFAGLDRFFSFYILFYGGYIVKKYGISSKDRSTLTHAILFAATFAVLLVCNHFGEIGLGQNSYENPFFLLLVSFAGWQLLYESAFFIKKLPFAEKTVVCIGQNTLAIVILHLLCFKIVSYIGVLIYHQPMCLVAAFPFLYQGGYWWIAYTIVGLFVPVSLSLIYKKWKTTLDGKN